MAEAGTPGSTGLIHMPQLNVTGKVAYQQIGGFGPVDHQTAYNAAKTASNVGRCKPSKIWVQGPAREDDWDDRLRQAVACLRAAKKPFVHVHKSSDALAGFGIYYLFGDKVIMEHTSDPESKVSVNKKEQALPHFHIEVIDYLNAAWATLPISDQIKKINGFKVFDNSTGQPKVQRLVRLGVADPSMDYDKPKFNHHIYYYPDDKALNL